MTEEKKKARMRLRLDIDDDLLVVQALFNIANSAEVDIVNPSDRSIRRVSSLTCTGETPKEKG